MHWQRAGLEVEELGHSPEPIWEANSAGDGFISRFISLGRREGGTQSRFPMLKGVTQITGILSSVSWAR